MLGEGAGQEGAANMTVVNQQVLDVDYRSDTAIGRFTTIRQAIFSGATACCGRFLAALHESRRKQGAIELARHRHLIYDADTGIHFGANPAAADRPLRF